MSTQALTSLVAGNATLWLTLNVFGEQLGLPVPAYPSLVVMGAAADEAELLLALLATVAVTGVADLLWYWAGRRHGAWLLRHLPGQHVPAATRLPGLLLVAKFVPGAAALATLSAGASAMPLRRFLAYDLGGATLWIGSGLALGRLFEAHILARRPCCLPDRSASSCWAGTCWPAGTRGQVRRDSTAPSRLPS